MSRKESARKTLRSLGYHSGTLRHPDFRLRGFIFRPDVWRSLLRTALKKMARAKNWRKR